MNANRKALAKYRLESARENVKSSKLLLDNGDFKGSVNRSYYAMFCSIRALLATTAVDFAKHSAVIAYFQREYIKNGILDVKYSDYIADAFQVQNKADYEDFYIVSKSKAQEQLVHAQELHDAISNLISGMA